MFTFSFSSKRRITNRVGITRLATAIMLAAGGIAPLCAQAQDGLKKSITPGHWRAEEGVSPELKTRFDKALGEALTGNFVVVESKAPAGGADEKKTEDVPEENKDDGGNDDGGDVFAQFENEARAEAKSEEKSEEAEASTDSPPKAPPGVQLTFHGTLTKADAPDELLVQAKVLHARTGEVLGTVETKAPGDISAAARQIADAAEAAAAKTPWEAQVSQVKTADNGVVIRVFLRAGARHGLKENMRFSVYRPGQPVTDPETGEVLEPAKDRRLGVVNISKVTTTSATAEPMLGDGFQPGDVIRQTPKSTRR